MTITVVQAMTNLEIRPATSADFGAAIQLLAAANLPVDDLVGQSPAGFLAAVVLLLFVALLALGARAV